jgi:hypothetical protein
MAPVATQEAGKTPPTAVEAGQEPGKADGSYEDEKKLRADSPAMSEYTCIVKVLYKVLGSKS